MSDSERLRYLERKLDRILAALGANLPTASERASTTAGTNATERDTDYFIGVQASLIDDLLRAQVDIPEGVGLVLKDVVAGSPAAQAGLKTHDILLEMGGKPLDSLRSLVSQVQAAKDQPTKTFVLRKGRSFRVMVTPAARKSRPGNAGQSPAGNNRYYSTANNQEGPPAH
jgi:S1-C subfamily serine protease